MSSDIRGGVRIAGFCAVAFASCAEQDAEDRMYANGRIEATEVAVAPEIAGRIREIRVEETDEVTEGELLVRLSSEELEAQLRRAEAEVRAARTAIAKGESQVALLEHHFETARTELERMRGLYEEGAASAQQLDQAEDAFQEMESRLSIARAELEQARAGLEAARAAQDVAETRLSEAQVVSPLDGIVLLRLAEEGEVVPAGKPLLVLIDPSDLRLEAFIAEDEVGKVRLGSPVRIRVDAFPDRIFEGVVSEIAQRAEFTPKDVHMPDERTELVFGVEIRIVDPEGYLKPGMPADAWIAWQESPREG